jgi:phage gp46-like protein
VEILLNDTGDGGEIELSGGDIKSDDTFYTSIYLSLFNGDTFYNVYENFETTNEFETAFNQPITRQNLKNVETAAKNALKWFIETGIADDVSVTAYGNTDEKINVDITITEPDGNSFLYGIIWENQKAVLVKK